MNLEMELNVWKLTDDDSQQHCQRLNDTAFSFIELVDAPDWAIGYGDEPGCYIVFHDVIDLRDYTLPELQTICHAFYGPSDDPIREIINEYGTMNAMQIIAECVFESIPYENMEFCAKRKTYEEAKQFMEDWMKEADRE